MNTKLQTTNYKLQSKLKITEIFRSIQGESSYMGQLCTFIRFAGCNLDCTYCDTLYAKSAGEEFSLKRLMAKVKSLSVSGLVEITGGEPLIQDKVPVLAEDLLNEGYKVLVETNGSLDVSKLSPKVIKIMDVKCPSSGESDSIHWPNLANLTLTDQVKFCLADETDYKWAKKVMADYSLQERTQVLLSTVWNKLSLATLADWIIKDNLQVTLQPQLHKVIWGQTTKM